MTRQNLKAIVASAVGLTSVLLLAAGCSHKEDLPPPVPVDKPTAAQATFEDQAAKGREADAKKRMQALAGQQGH